MNHRSKPGEAPSPAPVVWFTGKPNAGKTTVARALASRLSDGGRRVEILDGNELRTWLSSELGFSARDRRIHVVRVANLARLLSGHGVWCLVAVIAPYNDLREEVRRILGPSMVEVYLRCELEKLVAWDTKGLYARAIRGEIANFTGISDPFDEPAAPEMCFDSGREEVEPIVDQIWDWLKTRALL
jgi:adenylylsulfate kinase